MKQLEAFLNLLEFLLENTSGTGVGSLTPNDQCSVGVFHHIDGFVVFSISAKSRLLNQVVIDKRHLENHVQGHELMERFAALCKQADAAGFKILEMRITDPIGEDLREGAITYQGA